MALAMKDAQHLDADRNRLISDVRAKGDGARVKAKLRAGTPCARHAREALKLFSEAFGESFRPLCATVREIVLRGFGGTFRHLG
jgi:hypothetical protein